ncbi:hypothetical protein EG829_29830, partial [bacterium]|nr:hypothetical protein [bacterium]
MEKKGTGSKAVDILNRNIGVCALIIIASAVVYFQVHGHGFVNYDDPDYVTENIHVTTGLTIDNIRWAIGLPDRQYWAPLAWMSHMLDCTLFGVNPGMHHLMNVFIHMINSLLLFLVLKMMTGSHWRSAFVAGLFALHPVNVDTVAWIAERKNLLSTFFWLLSMAAYVRYVRRPAMKAYLLLAVIFSLGLLAKPMLVTLPFVFILMDFWPLGRVRLPKDGNAGPGGADESGRTPDTALTRIVAEKLPLIILSLAAIWISIQSLRATGSTTTVVAVPMGLRVENAVVSYAAYLWKMIWPAGLTFYYPYPDAVATWKVLGSAGVLALMTGCAAA